MCFAHGLAVKWTKTPNNFVNDALALRGNGKLCLPADSPSFMLSSTQFALLLSPTLPFKWTLSHTLSLSLSPILNIIAMTANPVLYRSPAV